MVNKSDLSNALIDTLELFCDNDDYYLINHAGPEKMQELKDSLQKWLESIGVKVV